MQIRTALLALLALPALALGAAAPPPIEGLKAGEDYTIIAGGAPYDTPPGQVEVAEMFNYACPACNSFNPLFHQWMGALPKYVHVVYVPMDFRADFVQYAHAYYAAETLGLVAKSHDAVFEAIHRTGALPGEGRAQDAATIARFYTRFGADAAEFQRTMESFSVSMKTTNAHQFAVRSRVDSTPSLVIDGSYLITGSTWTAILQNANRVIAAIHERAPPAR